MDAWHLGLLQQVASAAFVLCILHVGVLVACSNKKKRPTQVTNSMITQVGPPPTGPAKVQSKKEEPKPANDPSKHATTPAKSMLKSAEMPDELKSRPDDKPKSVKNQEPNAADKTAAGADDGYEQCDDMSESKLKKIAEGAPK
ncbi:hypothetical protein AAVH_04240 [Aphelenchoides avenae]|nr:hypothetical protein AAVH_04240 [Aphelenchus avenae]